MQRSLRANSPYLKSLKFARESRKISGHDLNGADRDHPPTLAVRTQHMSNTQQEPRRCRNSVMLLLFLTASSAANAYDLLVVGGGSAGLTAAKFGAATWKVRQLSSRRSVLGGDCTWTGCIPSKSLIASAQVANTVRSSESFGVAGARTSVSVDMAAVKSRIRRIIGEIYDTDDSAEALKKLGIDAISGNARLVDARSIAVTSGADGDSTVYTANKGIVVATGARPRTPPIDGIDSVPYLTYEQIFDLDVVPSKPNCRGGGPIGVELSQAFARPAPPSHSSHQPLFPAMSPRQPPISQAPWLPTASKSCRLAPSRCSARPG